MAGKFYTIGHSVNTAEKVLQLLKDNKATILVDVRSMPYSRHSPQFNKESFSKNLADAGIQYQWEKDAFGARQEDASLYHKNGYLDFAKMRARPIFKQKVAEYSKKVEQGENVVFMCSEKNPIDCHRAILVARGFALEGLPVEHILPDGKLMSQEELDKKLLDLHFPGHDQPSLFSEYGEDDKTTIIERAYELQNEKIGYKLEDVLGKVQNKDGQKMEQWTDVDEKGGLLTTKDRIGSFRGEHGFLSNMYDCPVTYKGVTYSCSESAYQAQRCAYDVDAKQFAKFSGVEAKKMARKVATREDWHSVKVGIMKEILQAKFTQNPNLGKQLVATGDRLLAEGNHWRDTFWGVYNGRGENTLGKLLMEVRDELKNEKLKPVIKTAPEKKDEYVIAVTGLRPNAMFGYDWSNEGNKALSTKIASTLKESVEEATKLGYNKIRVVTGMALGTDQMFTAHALRLARSDAYNGKISVEAALPMEGQEKNWSDTIRKPYEILLNACDKVTVCSSVKYLNGALKAKNKYLVDNADILLTAYDGKNVGDTNDCIEMATQKGIMVKDIGLSEILQEHAVSQVKFEKPSLKPKKKAKEENNIEKS